MRDERYRILFYRHHISLYVLSYICVCVFVCIMVYDRLDNYAVPHVVEYNFERNNLKSQIIYLSIKVCNFSKGHNLLISIIQYSFGILFTCFITKYINNYKDYKDKSFFIWTKEILISFEFRF